jgi:helicase
MCRLLVDGNATRAAVLEALHEAVADAEAGRADLVVVHFSCHGSPSGVLVVHDTERAHIDETGIPISDVVDLLGQLRDSPVVLTLDCCFAGTALGLAQSPNRESFDRLIHNFQSQSRIVACAAEFGQSAFEDREYGKGIFSHALCSRLSEAQSEGERDLGAFDWISGAVHRTTDLARTKGRSQTAAAFMLVRRGDITLRVARLGPHQLRLLVPADLPPVTPDVSSLGGHGLDEATIRAIRLRLAPQGTLNELQREAVAIGGVLRHQSVFVRAPTTAGKTLIAELAILGHQRTGRKSVVLLPLRALAREHARTFDRSYGASLGLRTIVSTGDAHDDDDLLIRGQFEVAFLTIEKFCAIIAARPQLQETIGLMVFDEMQTIAADGRGHTLELLLVQVRRWRATSQWPQLVVLCGELADITPLQQWLGLAVIASTHRPIPLEEAVIRSSTGDVRILNRTTGQERHEVWPSAVSSSSGRNDRARRVDAAVPVVKKLIGDGMQVLVFCSEKGQARRTAKRLAQSCGLTGPASLVETIGALDESTDHKTRALLREIVPAGVGLHLGDLIDSERNAIEDAFRNRELKVLVATSTLSQGVNLPADAVVFVDTERFGNTGDAPISGPDYLNIAGRAGRLIPGGPSRGLSVIVAQSQYSADELWERYVVAPPANLESSLGQLEFEDLSMLLLHQFDAATVNELTGALAGTYWAAAQGGDSEWRRHQRMMIESALARLETADLVQRVGDTEWSLTAVGRIAAGYGLRWTSAASISAAVERLRLASEPIDVLSLVVLTILTAEIEEIRLPTGVTNVPVSIPYPFERRQTLWDVLTDDGNSGNSSLVGDRLHRLEAISKWLSGTKLHEVETFFARTDKNDVVAAVFTTTVHRVSAVLPAVGAIVCHHDSSIAANVRYEVQRTRSQLDIGGGKHVATLHRLRLGLTRGQCLQLVEMGITNRDELSASLVARASELEPLLSTPGLQRLSSKLGDRRHQARVGESEAQLILAGFD